MIESQVAVVLAVVIKINNKDCGLLPTFITKGNAKFRLEVSENKDVLVCFAFQIHGPHYIPSTDLRA